VSIVGAPNHFVRQCHGSWVVLASVKFILEKLKFIGAELWNHCLEENAKTEAQHIKRWGWEGRVSLSWPREWHKITNMMCTPNPTAISYHVQQLQESIWKIKLCLISQYDKQSWYKIKTPMGKKSQFGRDQILPLFQFWIHTRYSNKCEMKWTLWLSLTLYFTAEKTTGKKNNHTLYL
jgi:hypothetical protein